MHQKIKLLPSTTPLEPDKNNAWKSAENIKDKVKKDIDKEFDVFTKERVDKVVKKSSPVPLEPNVLILNVPKNNLGTLKEDEEKHDEIHAKISETASSITQFCQNTFLADKDDPFTPKNNEVDPLILQSLKENTVLKLNLDDSPEKKIKEDSQPFNFDEISRKPRTLVTSKVKDNIENRRNSSMPENKPFLRDRSASIGTLHLKTPITQLIGEQNRTMLFQVSLIKY